MQPKTQYLANTYTLRVHHLKYFLTSCIRDCSKKMACLPSVEAALNLQVTIPEMKEELLIEEALQPLLDGETL